MLSRESLTLTRLVVRFQILVVVAGLAAISAVILAPLFYGITVEVEQGPAVKLPALDIGEWPNMPVQTGGRIMPFETAAINAVREICGRASPEFGKTKAQPVPLVLSWMLTGGSSSNPAITDWENYPFILCDHHGLRKLIFAGKLKPEEQPTNEQLFGKYVAPADLRNNPEVQQLLASAANKRELDSQKAAHSMLPEETKAEEVMRRLMTYDGIAQTAQLSSLGGGARKAADPFHWVALDRVPQSPWFAIGQLRENLADPQQWNLEMRERLARVPQLYIKPEFLTALQTLQKQIKAGNAKPVLDELEAELKTRREKQVADLERFMASNPDDRAKVQYLTELLATEADQRRLMDPAKAKERSSTNLVASVRAVLEERDRETVAWLRQQTAGIPIAKYHPENDDYRMVHLTYLESRFPDLYRESQAWQPFPTVPAKQVVEAYEAVQRAYRTADAAAFAAASQSFAALVRDTSKSFDPAYPIVTTLELERTYNRMEPFKWGWVFMAVAVLGFSLSMGLSSPWPARLGYLAFFVSLGFQTFGFYARTMISGRPPVSNMFETVIWVAGIGAVFSLILELAYRKKFAILSGSLVALFGLVLADQLPVGAGFDPKISPLEPVLRSNYWLIIHVLTIVSSYAGGMVAWVMGNLMLGIIYFRNPPREMLKDMATFCYRAMQIAVLLLAAGTFLGGWWAAESWGRFWGWDPKETWALIALIAYVIPLHMRYLGWIKEFGMALAAVVCFSSIVMAWYGVNFVLGAGLHSYGFGGGGPWWVFWAGLINLLWVLIVCDRQLSRQLAAVPATVAVTTVPPTTTDRASVASRTEPVNV